MTTTPAEHWIKEASGIQVIRHGILLGWLVNHTVIVSDGDVVVFGANTTLTGALHPIAVTIPVGEVTGFLQIGDVLKRVS